MFLSQIRLLNFKNHEEASIPFCENLNCIVGENGTGKTNLLDAIHYLCMTKSAFNSVEQQNIRHNEHYFMISGTFLKDTHKHEVVIAYQQGKKKIKINKKEYDKAAEHIGQFPCVIIAPNDDELIREGSEERRKFFDNVICQADSHYLYQLIRYNHALKQRNALLKVFFEKNNYQADLIEPYNVIITALAVEIYEKRKTCVAEFLPFFAEHYRYISGEKEHVSLEYQTKVTSTDFEKEFEAALRQDILLQRTTKGIHKDDYEFLIEGYPLKKYGSQGQQKSYVTALKLAQFDYKTVKKGIKPILLLDDIFDKLDDNRIAKLLEMITKGKFGQVFLTDARPERSKQFFNGLSGEVFFYQTNTRGI
jgi:DNA replication and repair protein RecF